MKSKAMLITATVMMVLLSFSLVGCQHTQHSIRLPRQQFAEPVEHIARHVKYELKESVDIKDDPAKPMPVISASIVFGQSW